MQPEKNERVAEIVEHALELEPDQRATLIADLCAGDAELRAEVESLLGFQEKAHDFIEAPAYELAAETIADLDGELRAGHVLGDYKIVSLIGAGGMGEVYLAEDISLGRKVAIKLVRHGFGHAHLVRHFRREEQILAALNHPNIARLYDAASTPDGAPYFVMEYVEGEPLDKYCNARALTITERLQLFRKVCAAVAYAHQHLVIHRDLKPANIRVTAEGEPKLLDFGIAKLLEADEIEQTITLQTAMTPEYASPEQVRGKNMTTASDVYSLGVVLYELLTGCRPYQIKSRRPDEIARAITEQEPTRPSTAITKSGVSLNSEILNPKLLRGDLDNIVLMALRKEPERRYSSVAQFSEDIRRHLEGRPVIARRDTVGYRTAKFVKRNRVAVSAAALILVAIVAGLIVALGEAENARRQRDTAQRERLKAQRINEFLQDMLGAAAPEAKGVDVKVVDVLSEASRRAKTEVATQPDVMADVLMTLGRTYISLGLFEPAVENLRAAVDASLKANGELHPTTATSMGWLGLALSYIGKYQEGEKISRQAVALQRKLHPEGNADLAVALYSLGMNLRSSDDPKSAERPLEEAVDLIGKHLGKNNGYYVAALTGLAMAREKLGNIDDAESLYRRAIEVGGGVEHRYRIYLAQASGYLGMLLTNKQSYADAESALRESERIYRDVLGNSNSSVPTIQASLGRLYSLEGDYARSEIEYRKALELMPKYFPPEHFIRLGATGGLGVTLTRLGKAAEGEHYLREALELREKSLPKEHYLIPFTKSALGECLMVQKRYGEAEPLLVSGYNELKAKFGEQDSRVIEARQRLDKLHQLK
jgi:tetratricopeptide (TPR) repeat protein